jgi:hypothetical protein
LQSQRTLFAEKVGDAPLLSVAIRLGQGLVKHDTRLIRLAKGRQSVRNRAKKRWIPTHSASFIADCERFRAMPEF